MFESLRFAGGRSVWVKHCSIHDLKLPIITLITNSAILIEIKALWPDKHDTDTN